MTFEEVVELIIGRKAEQGFLPKSSRVAEIINQLGNIDEEMALVHVTGTNGKSTTSKMIQSILSEHGLKTGLFSSPHIFKITERLSIDGEEISEEDFVILFESVIPLIEEFEEMNSDEPKLSFFEVLTVMAFCYFHASGCDAAVIEVGIGGTHDATNFIVPNVSVITNVDFDHAAILGNTIEEIAENKCGIIKPFVPVVAGKSADDEVEIEIAAIASENDSPLFQEESDLFVLRCENAVGGIEADLEIKGETFEEVAISLFGSVNAKNALLALQAAKIVLEDDFSKNGIEFDENKAREALSLIKIPARFEILKKDPLIVADIAHNQAAAASLKEAMSEREDIFAWIGIVAMSSDKDAASFFGEIADEFVALFITENENERSFSTEELFQIAKTELSSFSSSTSVQQVELKTAQSIETALENAIQTTKALETAMKMQTSAELLRVGIVVCGSAFNVAQASRFLKA